MSAAVIASKVANALIEDAQLSSPGDPGVNRALDRFRERHGGLWVGGRITLTVTSVEFRSNGLNKSLQTGSLDIDIDLRTIESVELLGGFVTKIVALRVGERVFKVRCFGAASLADRTRAAAQAVGSGA
ncbi:hypothetical protein [Mycobacteroides salmoniphilum]|uniref:hypothetical protein n=1 Tax=Mycobacteroides salmoniphilum TaxID=404941 RepID=UPI001066E3C4|nr:hypothetical protein [Mycobacteroides salmoniphilum]